MKISESSNSGIILICKSDIADDVSDKLSCYGVCVVPKPVNKVIFHQTLKIVSATRSRILGLQNENFKLQTKIEEIRLVNRAKCALIQYLKFSEPQAHRYIEKQAMDTRSTRKEVAQRILSTYET
jgi:response regulator NasT